MKPEQLMQTRYKVIAPWPAMGDYRVGDTILDMGAYKVCVNQNGIPVYAHDWYLYPHLFRKMEWHEDREVSEMPKYIRSGQRVFKVEEWIKAPHGMFHRSDIPESGFSTDAAFYWPATAEEYESYTRLSQ